MDLTLEQRVRNGAELLDAKRPGWHMEIELDMLDIDSVDHCILGQLYGSWAEGTRDLGIAADREAQSANGFDLTGEEYFPYERAEYLASRLEDLWAEEVTERCMNYV